MSTTPTPEQFLAQPSDPDEDATEPVSPLESIAQSLWTVVGILGEQAETGAPAVSEADELRQALDQADAEHQDLLVRNGVLAGRLEEIRAAVKPSTSKLANAVRAILDADDTVETVADAEPQTEPEPEALEQPADDADVEAWTRYAEARGYTVSGDMNRSQIRTMLGIPHPVAS